MHVYGTKDLQRLLGVSPSAVRASIRAGFISPNKGARGKLQYSFQDLIVVRIAAALRAARIPARRINRSLAQLRAQLPADLPLSGLSVVAIGDQIAVRDGEQRWESDSGQYVLAFDVSMEGSTIQIIDRPERPTVPAPDEDEHFSNAYALEDVDPSAALASYAKCLALNAGHAEARLNCGRLLHLAGRLPEAERMYRDAQTADATLLFNLAVLLEDLGRDSEAMTTYRQALDLDPNFADAHFNLARLHEQAGNPRDSLRHLLRYRRSLFE